MIHDPISCVVSGLILVCGPEVIYYVDTHRWLVYCIHDPINLLFSRCGRTVASTPWTLTDNWASRTTSARTTASTLSSVTWASRSVGLGLRVGSRSVSLDAHCQPTLLGPVCWPLLDPVFRSEKKWVFVTRIFPTSWDRFVTERVAYSSSTCGVLVVCRANGTFPSDLLASHPSERLSFVWLCFFVLLFCCDLVPNTLALHSICCLDELWLFRLLCFTVVCDHMICISLK